MNQYKKWCKFTLITTLIILVFISGIVVVLDPFAQYHTPWFNLKLVFSRNIEAYINPGVAKNFSYDSVLLGSSVSENFYVSQINSEYDCNTVKLSYAGGSTMNYCMVLDVAFKNRSLKNVFYSVDMFGLIYDADIPRNSPAPEYLYNSNPFDDTAYLLNKDVMLLNISQILSANRRNTVVDYDLAYNWNESCTFSADTVLSLYSRAEQSDIKLPADYYYPMIDASMLKFKPLVEEHPETRFIVFYPPYSVIQHDYYIRNGEFDAFCAGMLYSMERWLEFDNVEVYSFVNCSDIITDLSNYREMMHFSEQINTYMIEEMAKGNFRITKENCRKEMDNFYNFIGEYDYSKFFPAA